MAAVVTELAKIIVLENRRRKHGPLLIHDDGEVSERMLLDEVDDRIVELIREQTPERFMEIVTTGVEYYSDLLQDLYEVRGSTELLMRTAVLNVHHAVLDMLKSTT